MRPSRAVNFLALAATVVAVAAAALVAPAFPAAQSPPDPLASARAALLREDFAAARAIAEGSEPSSARTAFLSLVAELDLDAACASTERLLTLHEAGHAATTITTAINRCATLPAESPALRRARALLALANASRPPESANPSAFLAALDAAELASTAALEDLARRRAAVEKEVEEQITVIQDSSRLCEAEAGKYRLTEAVTARDRVDAAIEKLTSRIAASETLFDNTAFATMNSRAKTVSDTAIEQCGHALTRMLYFLRNVADARQVVEKTLTRVPPTLRLVELKQKIEEWNTRHRLFGDNPNG